MASRSTAKRNRIDPDVEQMEGQEDAPMMQQQPHSHDSESGNAGRRTAAKRRCTTTVRPVTPPYLSLASVPAPAPAAAAASASASAPLPRDQGGVTERLENSLEAILRSSQSQSQEEVHAAFVGLREAYVEVFSEQERLGERDPTWWRRVFTSVGHQQLRKYIEWRRAAAPALADGTAGVDLNHIDADTANAVVPAAAAAAADSDVSMSIPNAQIPPDYYDDVAWLLGEGVDASVPIPGASLPTLETPGGQIVAAHRPALWQLSYHGRVFEFDPVEHPIVLIGQRDGCDVRLDALPENSRLHAILFLCPNLDRVYVVDVGSLNGIATLQRRHLVENNSSSSSSSNSVEGIVVTAPLESSTCLQRKVLEFRMSEWALLRLSFQAESITLNARTCAVCLAPPPPPQLSSLLSPASSSVALSTTISAACPHMNCCATCTHKKAPTPHCHACKHAN